MPTILLVRHGENDYVKKGRLAGRLPGVHLNDTGRRQAAWLAEKLKATPVKAIYSSPLERTLETARPLAEALSLEIQPRFGLIEVDCGDWQDQSLKQLKRLQLWKIVQASPSSFTFPGGESFFAAQQRIVAELQSIARQSQPKDLLVCVSHSDPIKLAVAYLIGLPLDLFQRLNVSPGSTTALSIGEASASLLAMNVQPDTDYKF